MPLDPELQEFTTSPPAIATFDYQDIADGTGISEFFLCSQTDSSSTTYFLTPKSIYSSQISFTNKAISSTVETEHNFDVTFVVPRTIAVGNAYANISFDMTGNADSSSLKVEVELFHYDGSTATEVSISGKTSQTIPSRTPGVFLLELPITTRVHFGEGEILRAEVTATTVSGNGTTNSLIGIDPKDRTMGSAVTSTSKLLVPFVLEV